MTIKKGTDKAAIDRLIDRLKSGTIYNGVDAYKYCGVISLDEKPEKIQKTLRSEWD